MKIEARFDHAVVPAATSSIVHILLTLTAPEADGGTPRPDLNIAAVIDRSGSMSGEKLEYAKEAVRVLLDQLAPKDTFSLVAFDDEVLPLIEASQMADRTEAKALVEQIETGGTTNLSGGWIKGIELVSRAATDDCVNAVLLLTDGQANEGITDHDKLVGMGESVQNEKSIRTTCMGLGQDFAEDLLRDIAAAAGGRFYYIESPEHAPEIFDEELGGLLAVVAQNVEIELKFADGVSGIAQLTGHPWKTGENSCRLILGDFGAAQVKHVLLAAQLPAIDDISDVLLASMDLKYAEIDAESVQIKGQKQDLVVRVGDEAEATASADPEVLLHIGMQKAAQARKAAVSKLDEGDLSGAALMLDDQTSALRSMAFQASDPGQLNKEADELEQRAQELRETQDATENRKFMVAEGDAMARTMYSNVSSARQRRSRPRPPDSQTT